MAEATKAPRGNNVCPLVKKFNFANIPQSVISPRKRNNTAKKRTVTQIKSPPIVGVPDFVLWRADMTGADFSSRICFFILYLYKKCVKRGVQSMATLKDRAVRIKILIMEKLSIRGSGRFYYKLIRIIIYTARKRII